MRKSANLITFLLPLSLVAFMGAGCNIQKANQVLDPNYQSGPTVTEPIPAPPTPTQAPAAHFEFLNPNDNWKPLDGLNANDEPHIVVASSGDPDIRTKLPINLELRVDGATVWRNYIPNNPKEDCRDATGCSIQGPRIKPEWAGHDIELIATDKDGNVIADYQQ